MSATETTPSIDPCHHIPDYDDPNRIVELKLKASDLQKIRKLCALMTTQTKVKAISQVEHLQIMLEVIGSDGIEMNRLHDLLYGQEMGWEIKQV